jgi:maleylpyruvate isomerase
MKRQDVSVTLPWMGAGTELLLRAVGALPDDALADPSRLPGWSRAHVIAHVARNAEALTRLANWARTGVETPMYLDREQRARDIEQSSRAPVEQLREELIVTAATLDAAFAALDEQSWQAPVRSAVGRPIPAAEVPWMRVREVWLHAVDLDAGVGIAELPPDVVDALLDDATGTLSMKDDCPAVRLIATDSDRGWLLGPDTDPVAVRGAAADLLGWLIGRQDAEPLRTDGAPVPVLPPWL